ncbi:MAG: sigma-70 family RNA polymerase sigma factor [Acidimicrobiia bacterium]
MWTVSDEALLAGMAAGDADAATAFVERFQRRVYGLALTIVGEPRAAEDAAQEAFLRAWRHAAAYDARRGSVATWLLTIARNAAIDLVRVRRPVAMAPETLAAFDERDWTADPADRSVVADDARRLHAALQRLSDEQRHAVMLAGLYGYTAREIAEIEGIPLGTAKTRIRTALIRLRGMLVREEQE